MKKEMKTYSNIIAVDFVNKKRLDYFVWKAKKKKNLIRVGQSVFEYPVYCTKCNRPVVGAEDTQGNTILLCTECKKFKRL